MGVNEHKQVKIVYIYHEQRLCCTSFKTYDEVSGTIYSKLKKSEKRTNIALHI